MIPWKLYECEAIPLYDSTFRSAWGKIKEEVDYTLLRGCERIACYQHWVFCQRTGTYEFNEDLAYKDHRVLPGVKEGITSFRKKRLTWFCICMRESVLSARNILGSSDDCYTLRDN